MVVAMGVCDGTVVIRRAGEADARGIAEVRIRTWREAYSDLMPTDFLNALSFDATERRWRESLRSGDPSRRMQVAESAGQVVGFVSAGVPRDEPAEPLTGEVYAIYVTPDCWDRGVGRKLLAHAEKDLTDLGYTEAMLWVLTDNQRARAFYERAGWHADGATKRATFGGREVEEVRYRIALGRSRAKDPA
jgi:ribosomal protein S18 acetylase RimI-like enzyme